MTAVSGYECDRCHIFTASKWRNLHYNHGWIMAAQPVRHPEAIGTQHFCGDCTRDLVTPRQDRTS